MACKRPAKFEVCTATTPNKADNKTAKHCDEHTQRLFQDYLAFGDKAKMLAVRTI